MRVCCGNLFTDRCLAMGIHVVIYCKTETEFKSFMSPLRATCSAHLILFHIVILIMAGENMMMTVSVNIIFCPSWRVSKEYFKEKAHISLEILSIPLFVCKNSRAAVQISLEFRFVKTEQQQQTRDVRTYISSRKCPEEKLQRETRCCGRLACVMPFLIQLETRERKRQNCYAMGTSRDATPSPHAEACACSSPCTASTYCHKHDAFLGQGASRLRLIMTRSDVSLDENTRNTGSADPKSESDNLHINTLFTSKNVSGIKVFVVRDLCCPLRKTSELCHRADPTFRRTHCLHVLFIYL
jgi:hypothetical protein